MRRKPAGPPPYVGGYEKVFEGICGWIPHEQVEGKASRRRSAAVSDGPAAAR